MGVEAMTVHVVSPHLDDAVLSVGQTMLGFEEPVEVVSVFAGVPEHERLTPYDRSCGFASSVEAMESRIAEDEAACRVLGVTCRHFPFLDSQYARQDSVIAEALRVAVLPLWEHEEIVFGPLGVGHPDHVFVRDAMLRALPARLGLWLYEELPYRVLHPELAVASFAEVRSHGFDIAPLTHPWPQGPLARKSVAIAEYRSQFPEGAVDPCLLVPERTWQVTRRAFRG